MRTTLLVIVAAFGLGLSAFAQERRPAIKHPVLEHKIDPGKAESYEKAVARLMAMSEEEMLKLIPVKAAVLFCGCPNCSGGQQENGQFNWTIERPFELGCKFCGHVYPSEKYPPNWTAAGLNMLGETVTYKYYFDEKTKRDYWLEACADYARRSWFVGQCLALATAYHATRKPQYARRAALILNRFAKAYPHMAVLYQWPYRRRAVAKPTPPYPNAGGKWGRWMSDEVPARLPEAYDLIYESSELDTLSQQEGADVRRRIENDFFRAAIDYTFTFGKEPAGVHLNNMAPFYTRNIIAIGRVIGDPEYVHWGYRWVENILQDSFFYDGMWQEAPSYHYQTIGGIRRVIAALKGYSDPPGYRSPQNALRLEDLDLEVQLPVVQKAFRAPDLIAYPSGHICPVHDSWAKSRTSAARDRTVSTILPGFGHASLGCGSGENQLQAQLHFSGGYGHQHADNLNLSLYAKGAELLSDIGYTHSKLRCWTTSTIGHNTVAINRESQASRDSDGDLLMFVPDAGGLRVVEACGKRAYPNLAEVYRRQLILVPVSETDAYIVDVFRVRGGQTHDWLLHGSADEDMTAECSLPLAAREGTLLESDEKWVEPIGESSSFNPYGLMREVRGRKIAQAFAVTFRCVEGERGVRVHMPGDSDMEVLLAKTPRIRQAEGDDRKVYDYWMPQLVARRRGTAPVTSVFAAVHEPFKPQPFIQEAKAVSLEPPADFAAALQVRHGDFTDTIISTLDEPPFVNRSAGGAAMRGRMAVLRERAGEVVGAWMVGGASLTKGGFSLTSEHPRYEGIIESAARKADKQPEDAFITSVPLPAGNALAGQWMVVTHGSGHTHGYEISRVEQRAGKTVIVLADDHGLKITADQTEEAFFPRRKFTGPNRFLIQGLAVFPKPE